MSNFTQSLQAVSPSTVEQYLGPEKFKKYNDITSGKVTNSDLPLMLEFDKDLLKTIIWHTDTVKAQAESEINSFDIPADMKNRYNQQIESQAEMVVQGEISLVNNLFSGLSGLPQLQTFQPFNEQELRSGIPQDIANNPLINPNISIPASTSIANITSPTAGTNPLTTSVPVPNWVRNTAKWWSLSLISDDDFIKEVQYMIENHIMKIPSVQTSSISSHIPEWVKNAAGLWSNGKLSDDEFVRAMQYLAQIGIIQIKS
jgi:hypothetical protein